MRVVECQKWEAEANFTVKASPEMILKMVFDHTGWTWKETYEATGKSGSSRKAMRSKEQVYRRQLISFLCYHNGNNLRESSIIGNQDHTTIMNSLQKMENRLDTDPYVVKDLRELVAFLRDNYHLYVHQNITLEDIKGGK